MVAPDAVEHVGAGCGAFNRTPAHEESWKPGLHRTGCAFAARDASSGNKRSGFCIVMAVLIR